VRRLPGFLLLIATFLSAMPLAQAEEFVVVVNRIVYPGETVATDAIEEVPFVRTGRISQPIVMRRGEIEGKVARRTILPGRLVPSGALREPYLVEAGAPVVVLYVQGALTISATAVPLQPGSAGDMVRLRNVDSGKIFTGTVMADGTVRVGAT
jgi:flagella basal body P-ring formation protein FlgA